MTRRREIRPMMSGELRHVCNIEQLIAGVDATGAPLATYQLWAQNVRYAIDDWKPYEVMQAAQLGNELNTRIRMRWRPGIVESMRLVMITNPGCSPAVYEYYDIVGAVRDIILRVEIQLTCVKRTSPGFRVGITENVAGYGGPGAEYFPTSTVGPAGPAGPPGPPGPAGTGGSAAMVALEQVAQVSGGQMIALPQAIGPGWYTLGINGVAQSVTGYTVSGRSLILPPALNIAVGDLIAFAFYPLT
jgi:head-tail adaptor